MTTEIEDLKALSASHRKESLQLVLLALGLGAAVLVGSYVYGVHIFNLM